MPNRRTREELQAARQETWQPSPEELPRSSASSRTDDDSAPWMRFAGLVASGDPDSSRRIDEVVYSRKP